MQFLKNILSHGRYLAAGGALAAAGGTAHFMQSSGADDVQVTANAAIASPAVEQQEPLEAPQTNEVTIVAAIVEDKPAVSPVADEPVVDMVSLKPEAPQVPVIETTAAVEAELPTPPVDVLMPKPLPQSGEELADRMAPTVNDPGLDTTEISADIPQNEFGLPCGPILSASARDLAMVALTLTAPCRGEEAVTVRHGDLEFSGALDRLGNFAVVVPAMQAEADFSITFPDGESAYTYVDVPEAEQHERVALMFQHQAGLQIHALEFGADYGEDGHVWAENPRDPATAEIANGGFLTLMGDRAVAQPYVAEIYTFPASTTDRDGVVRLSVEAEVTAFNCAKDISGETIERGPDGVPVTTDITISIPDCAAIGEFLVLKNLLRDLRIASN